MTINLYELAGELLAQGQPIRFRAPGRSMEPTIPDGAEIVVEPLSPDVPVQVGDIVLARVGDRLIAHRVIAVEGDGATARLFLRGDAQREVVDCVSRVALLGRVTPTFGGRTPESARQCERGHFWHTIAPPALGRVAASYKQLLSRHLREQPHANTAKAARLFAACLMTFLLEKRKMPTLVRYAAFHIAQQVGSYLQRGFLARNAIAQRVSVAAAFVTTVALMLNGMVFGQRCDNATPVTRITPIAPLTGVVNSYYPGQSVVNGPNSSTITIKNTVSGQGVNVGIAVGDMVLVMQMQDATIDSSNNANYGAGTGTGSGQTSQGNAGRYEFARVIASTVTSLTSGGTITVRTSDSGGGTPLANTYTDANATATQGQRRFQVIRVPQYTSVGIGVGLTCAPWDGNTGGVLAIDVQNVCQFTIGSTNGVIDVSGRGFRGGGGKRFTGSGGYANTDFRNTTPASAASLAAAHASKGEGIAGTPRYVVRIVNPNANYAAPAFADMIVADTGVEGYPNGSLGYGAPGNAGGGGTDGNASANDQNTGGGGGSNAGAGGQGGFAWSSALDRGGRGGAAQSPTLTRIFMGGGGGAGTSNNGAGNNANNNDDVGTNDTSRGAKASSGAAGGGIVFIRAGTILGTGTIRANGANAQLVSTASGMSSASDSSGGGGGGGSIVLTATQPSPATLTIQAQGGNGGSNSPNDTGAKTSANAHGPGGGGGGGVVFLTSTITGASVSTTGGQNGITLFNGPPPPFPFAYGATPGADGTNNNFNITITDVPGLSSSAECDPPVLTDARFTNASATRYATGAAVVEWATGYEANNLGFHVWREIGGKRERITPELIAGSALLTSDALTAGQHYVWRDDALRLTRAPVNYWLEAYDVDGSRQWYGPITLRETREAFPLHLRNSPLLGRGAAATGGRQIEVAPNDLTTPPASPGRKSATGDLAMQQRLAGRAAVKLYVGQTGWQRVTWAALWAAGLSRMADPANLQLYVEGRETPLRVTSEGVEFYGVAADTLDSGEAVYWLIEGDRPGRRVELGASFPLLRPTLQSFWSATTRADKSVYFAALLNGDEDNFFGSVVTTTPVEQTVTVRDPDPSGRRPVEVTVELQGVSLGEHAVSVAWNGRPLGVVNYSGRTVGRGVWTLPADQVMNGINTITLHAPTAGDVNLVKSLTVAYERRLRAADNRLVVNVPRDGAGLGRHILAIDGFTAAARAFDVTDATAPVELPVRMTGETATIAAAPGRQVIVTTSAAMATPRAEANRPSHWHRGDHAVDFVIITHEAFRPAADRLARARQAEGLRTAVVDITDVYDEWSYGVKSAGAVRDFLRHAATAWARPARYALLVGNATFDPRDYLGFGGNFIPTKLIGVGALETAVDDWLGDLDEAGLARLAVGRLPVKTLAEAELVVSKILAYEQAGDADWKRRALVVADNPDGGGDFDAAASDVLELLPHPGEATPIRLSALGAGGARAALLAGLNAGAGLVNYIGHGSVQNWAAENVLTSGDAATLGNHDRAGLVVSMTCLTGFHHDLYTTALGKALMLAPGGAAAVWASSALTPSDGQHWANLALLDAIYGLNPVARLGEAVQRAKAATGDPQVRQSWTLLGDPTMRLR